MDSDTVHEEFPAFEPDDPNKMTEDDVGLRAIISRKEQLKKQIKGFDVGSVQSVDHKTDFSDGKYSEDPLTQLKNDYGTQKDVLTFWIDHGKSVYNGTFIADGPSRRMIEPALVSLEAYRTTLDGGETTGGGNEGDKKELETYISRLQTLQHEIDNIPPSERYRHPNFYGYLQTEENREAALQSLNTIAIQGNLDRNHLDWIEENGESLISGEFEESLKNDSKDIAEIQTHFQSLLAIFAATRGERAKVSPSPSGPHVITEKSERKRRRSNVGIVTDLIEPLLSIMEDSLKSRGVDTTTLGLPIDDRGRTTKRRSVNLEVPGQETWGGSSSFGSSGSTLGHKKRPSEDSTDERPVKRKSDDGSVVPGDTETDA